jgi:hypothetical protein
MIRDDITLGKFEYAYSSLSKASTKYVCFECDFWRKAS